MEHIQIHFPETWTHNRCDDWMVQHELRENGRDIKEGHHVYTVLIKENEVEYKSNGLTTTTVG